MRIATLVLLIAATTFQSAAASEISLPHVTVFGTAITEVTPDILNWNITIRNQGADLERVATQHSEIVARVLELLKDKGIKEEETQTANMRFGENWEYRNSSRIKSGYVATTAISFKMTDLSMYRDVWIGLAGIGQVDIDRVSLDTSNRIATQNETRTKALIAAREKASAMAKTLGAEIHEPLAVEEMQDSIDVWSNRAGLSNSISFSQSAGDLEGGAALSPGRIPVKIRVKVSFRLVGNG